MLSGFMDFSIRQCGCPRSMAVRESRTGRACSKQSRQRTSTRTCVSFIVPAVPRVVRQKTSVPGYGTRTRTSILLCTRYPGTRYRVRYPGTQKYQVILIQLQYTSYTSTGYPGIPDRVPFVYPCLTIVYRVPALDILEYQRGQYGSD